MLVHVLDCHSVGQARSLMSTPGDGHFCTIPTERNATICARRWICAPEVIKCEHTDLAIEETPSPRYQKMRFFLPWYRGP